MTTQKITRQKEKKLLTPVQLSVLFFIFIFHSPSLNSSPNFLLRYVRVLPRDNGSLSWMIIIVIIMIKNSMCVNLLLWRPRVSELSTLIRHSLRRFFYIDSIISDKMMAREYWKDLPFLYALVEFSSNTDATSSKQENIKWKSRVWFSNWYQPYRLSKCRPCSNPNFNKWALDNCLRRTV